ncbi:MAG: hypothetical protein AAF830_17600, partial [Pseudomonadota bacterium]
MKIDPLSPILLNQPEVLTEPEDVVARLEKLYTEQIAVVADRFEKFADGSLEPGDPNHAVYPAIEVEVPAERATLTSSLALGRVSRRHNFATTITHPTLFSKYLIRQLTKIKKR